MARLSYTPEIAAKICERLAAGESLRKICLSDDMPCQATVFVWLAKHPDFVEQYAPAREAQAHNLAAEIIDIADDSSHDTVTRTREDGSEYEAVDQDHINRSRLRVDARKWYASKLAPKFYGDKITQEHTGANGAPLSATIVLTGRPESSPAPKAMGGDRDGGD